MRLTYGSVYEVEYEAAELWMCLLIDKATTGRESLTSFIIHISELATTSVASSEKGVSIRFRANSALMAKNVIQQDNQFSVKSCNNQHIYLHAYAHIYE